MGLWSVELISLDIWYQSGSQEGPTSATGPYGVKMEFKQTFAAMSEHGAAAKYFSVGERKRHCFDSTAVCCGVDATGLVWRISSSRGGMRDPSVSLETPTSTRRYFQPTDRMSVRLISDMEAAINCRA